MPTNLKITANEKSALVVRCVFRDEDGALVVPNAIAWSLTTPDGAVINSRSAVPVAAPASTVDILLSGADLAIVETGGGTAYARRLAVEATYTSSLGVDIPLTAEAEFIVSNLVAIT